MVWVWVGPWGQGLTLTIVMKKYVYKGNVRLSLVSAPEVHNHPIGEDIAHVARMVCAGHQGWDESNSDYTTELGYSIFKLIFPMC